MEVLYHRVESRIELHTPFDKDLMTKESAIRYIQEALSNDSLHTTEGYTFVAKDTKTASSPDNLEI